MSTFRNVSLELENTISDSARLERTFMRLAETAQQSLLDADRYLSNAETKVFKRQVSSQQAIRTTAFISVLDRLFQKAQIMGLGTDVVASRVARTLSVYSERVERAEMLSPKYEPSFVIPLEKRVLERRFYMLTSPGLEFLQILLKKKYKKVTLADLIHDGVIRAQHGDVSYRRIGKEEQNLFGFDPGVSRAVESIRCVIIGKAKEYKVTLTSCLSKLKTFIVRKRKTGRTSFRSNDDFTYSFHQTMRRVVTCDTCQTEPMFDGSAFECATCYTRIWRFDALIRPTGRYSSRLKTGAQFLTHNAEQYMLTASTLMEQSDEFFGSCMYTRRNTFEPPITYASSKYFEFMHSAFGLGSEEQRGEEAEMHEDGYEKHANALLTRNLSAMLLYAVLALLPRCIEEGVRVSGDASTTESLLEFTRLNCLIPSDRKRLRIPHELAGYVKAVTDMVAGRRTSIEERLGAWVIPDKDDIDTTLVTTEASSKIEALMGDAVACTSCRKKDLDARRSEECEACKRKRSSVIQELTKTRYGFITKGVGNGEIVPQVRHLTADLPATLSRLAVCVMGSCVEPSHPSDFDAAFDCLAVSALQLLYAVMGFEKGLEVQGSLMAFPTISTALQGLAYLPETDWQLGKESCLSRGGFVSQQTSAPELAMVHAFAADYFGDDYGDKTLRDFVSLENEFPEAEFIFARLLSYIVLIEPSSITRRGQIVRFEDVNTMSRAAKLTLAENERVLNRIKELSTYCFRNVITGNETMRGQVRADRTVSGESSQIADGIVGINRQFLNSLKGEVKKQLAPLSDMISTDDVNMVEPSEDQNRVRQVAKNTSSGGALTVSLKLKESQGKITRIGDVAIRNLKIKSSKKTVVMPVVNAYLRTNLPFDGEATLRDLYPMKTVETLRVENMVQHNITFFETLLHRLANPSPTGTRHDTLSRVRVFYIIGIALLGVSTPIGNAMKKFQKTDPRFANAAKATPDGQLVHIQLCLAEGLSSKANEMIFGAQNEFSRFDGNSVATIKAMSDEVDELSQELIRPENFGFRSDTKITDPEYIRAVAARPEVAVWLARKLVLNQLASDGILFSVDIDGRAVPGGRTNLELVRYRGNPSGISGTTEINSMTQSSIEDFEGKRRTFWNDNEGLRGSMIKAGSANRVVTPYTGFRFGDPVGIDQYYGDDGMIPNKLESLKFECQHDSANRHKWWINLTLDGAEIVGHEYMGILYRPFRNLFPQCSACRTRCEACHALSSMRTGIIGECGHSSPVADMLIGNLMAFLSRRTEGPKVSIRGRSISSEGPSGKSVFDEIQEVRSMQMAGVRTRWRTLVILGLARADKRSTFGREERPPVATLLAPPGLVGSQNGIYSEFVLAEPLTSITPLTAALHPDELQPPRGARILIGRESVSRIQADLLNEIEGCTISGDLTRLVPIAPVGMTMVDKTPTTVYDAEFKKNGDIVLDRKQMLRLLRGQSAQLGRQGLTLPKEASDEIKVSYGKQISRAGLGDDEVVDPGFLRLDRRRESMMLDAFKEQLTKNAIFGAKIREAEYTNVTSTAFKPCEPSIKVGREVFHFGLGQLSLVIDGGVLGVYTQTRTGRMQLLSTVGMIRSFTLAGRPSLTILRALFEIRIEPRRTIGSRLLAKTDHRGFDPVTGESLLRFIEANKGKSLLTAYNEMGLTPSEIAAVQSRYEGAQFANDVGEGTYSSSISDMLQVVVPSQIQNFYKREAKTSPPAPVFGVTQESTTIINESLLATLDNVLCNEIQYTLLQWERRHGENKL